MPKRMALSGIKISVKYDIIAAIKNNFAPRITLLRDKREDIPEININAAAKKGCKYVVTVINGLIQCWPNK